MNDRPKCVIHAVGLLRINSLLENISKSYISGWEPETRVAHANSLINALNIYIVGAKQNVNADPDLAKEYQEEWRGKVRKKFITAFQRLGEADSLDITDELPTTPYQFLTPPQPDLSQ